MIDCRDPNKRVSLSADTVQVGTVVHSKISSQACQPWLVIGQEGVSPLLGEAGWRILEIGPDKFKDNSTGKVLGSGEFTGRSSTLRPSALRNFHTVMAREQGS